MFDLEWPHMMIIQFDSRVSSVEVFGIEPDFIFNEVMRTRTVRSIGTEFIYDLSYQHLYSEMLSEIFHLLSEVLNM